MAGAESGMPDTSIRPPSKEHRHPNRPPSQPTTSTQTDKDTIPKALPSGVYSKLVEDYNSITLDGVRRAFPEKLLLGAEKVLARMYHEHHTSKLYTATPLGDHGTTSLD